MSQQWWVYMVQTQSGKLYTGVSTDVDRRFKEHQAMSVHHLSDSGDKSAHALSASAVIKGTNVTKIKDKGAKFFYFDPAQAIVYRELCINRSEACKREAQIKKFSRRVKAELVGLAYPHC